MRLLRYLVHAEYAVLLLLAFHPVSDQELVQCWCHAESNSQLSQIQTSSAFDVSLAPHLEHLSDSQIFERVVLNDSREAKTCDLEFEVVIALLRHELFGTVDSNLCVHLEQAHDTECVLVVSLGELVDRFLNFLQCDSVARGGIFGRWCAVDLTDLWEVGRRLAQDPRGEQELGAFDDQLDRVCLVDSRSSTREVREESLIRFSS